MEKIDWVCHASAYNGVAFAAHFKNGRGFIVCAQTAGELDTIRKRLGFKKRFDPNFFKQVKITQCTLSP